MDEWKDKSIEELLVLAEHDPEAQYQLGMYYGNFNLSNFLRLRPRVLQNLQACERNKLDTLDEVDELLEGLVDQPDTARKEEASGETGPDTAELQPFETWKEKAEEWFRKAAEGGHVEAMFQLGERHAKWENRLLSGGYMGGHHGRSLASGEEREQAAEWYRRAAERGHVEAMFCLGELYRPRGEWPPLHDVSWPQAAEWYHKAAERGHVQAMVQFAEYCGISCTTEGKDEEAIYRFDIRMAQNMEFDGQEKKADLEQAFCWYRKAAELGDVTAQRRLGGCYLHGCGVEQDKTQAIAWYRKAAEQGDPSGLVELGDYYLGRCGAERNEIQAAAWYRRAAELGDPDAHWKLGDCYLDGRGVEQDQAQAVEWYLKVSGNSTAQRKLGDCYLYGYGVEQDEDEAVDWYRASAEQGNFSAIDALKDLGIDEYW